MADTDEPSDAEHLHSLLLDLLRRALAWRAQGAPSKWSSGPSTALAIEVDRFAGRFPALVAELQPPPDDDSVMREARLQNDRERLRELVPEALREAYHEDPVIHSAFATAMYGGLTRESALVRIVQELLADRARLTASLLKRMREGQPPTHLIEGPVQFPRSDEDVAMAGGQRALLARDQLARDQRARELVARADRGEGRHDVKLVVEHLRAHHGPGAAARALGKEQLDG